MRHYRGKHRAPDNRFRTARMSVNRWTVRFSTWQDISEWSFYVTSEVES